MEKLALSKQWIQIFKSYPPIQSCILIGSFGRGEPKPNSDIDYQLWMDSSFTHKDFITFIQNGLKKELKYFIYIKGKNKYCFYYGLSYQKIEIFICEKLQDLDKYYLGSEIENIKPSIVYDKTQKVKPYLEKITKDKIKNMHKTLQTLMENLIIDFQTHFEDASFNHSKSDGYKFYVSFSHALNAVIRMIYLCEGEQKYAYMPPNFLTDYSRSKGLKIESLEKIMNLKKANQNKKFLSDLFKKYLALAIEKFNLGFEYKKIVLFLEAILKRDYFWNFRDAAKFNTQLKSNVLYRTSTLTRYQNETAFEELLKENNITKIIDLRANRELKEDSYNEKNLKKILYLHAPFDPWSQSEKFKQESYNLLKTDNEKAYLFFISECKTSIKKIIEGILENKGATAIHCHAGKDRTGVVFTLFHLLAAASEKEIQNDYLASEMDTDLKLLKIVLEHIKNEGGIVSYLKSCDLSEGQIENLIK